jgi:hypothetical protein
MHSNARRRSQPNCHRIRDHELLVAYSCMLFVHACVVTQVLEEVLKARAKLLTAAATATTNTTAATHAVANCGGKHKTSNDSSSNSSNSNDSSTTNSSGSSSDMSTDNDRHCGAWYDSWHSQGWNSVVQRDLQRALVDPFHGVRAVACSCYTHLLDSDWSNMAQVT